MNRVVITGLGAVTPIGNDVETFWAALKEKKIGFAPISTFDTAEYKVKLAAEVKNFDAKQYMDAKARGAKIYAELAGYGAICDAYHITSPAEDGSGAAQAMLNAMKDGGVKPEEIDYINAHGTGTHHNDLFETKAIKAALGSHAYQVKINSTKSMIGHLLGAAGGVECIVCAKTIADGYVHATAGLSVDDPECDLDYTKGDGVCMEVNCAISNSLGFGGHNASLLLKKFVE